jgi:hypothetical protein
MSRVLALYSVTYVVILSNGQQLQNKNHSLLFIEKSKKSYKLEKYQFVP